MKSFISDLKFKILAGQVLCLFLHVTIPSYSQPDIALLEYWKYYSNQKNIVYKSLTDIALGQLDEREQSIRSLKNKEGWMNRQSEVKERLQKIIGDFPEKTPLNPKVTGTLKGDGFHVEKVVYESQPGLYVTAALFIPDKLKGKAPAILYCSGHTFDAFRSEVYQYAIINLTRKGFIVLAFDPIGQGERLLYLDQDKKKSIYDTPTHEHSYVGGQCFISGQSLAKYMIWDGIRSIDYLLSRKEVDPQRIGITGRSGGGTQSVYISAYDDRILAAAPENYVTGFRYLLTSIGPQDAEQNLPHFLKNNLDFADFLEVRMPKPTLIVSTLNDFFSIQGVRETFKEVQKAYGAFNAEEKFQKTEDVAEHASTLKNREATYAFFQKYLDNPGDPKDENVAIFDKEDLMVTSTGQVLTAYQAETIFSLNKKESLKIIEDRIKQKGELIADQNYLNKSIRALTGYTDLKEDNHYTFSGSVKYDQLTVYKYLIDGNQARKIPLVVIIPESSDKEKAVIILSPEGKAVELVSGLPEYLASQGYYVILPDLSGSGELSDPSQRGDSYISHSSYNMWYAGILTGKSLISLRLEDIASVCKFAMQEFELKEGNLYGIARDVFTSDLLHANILSGCFSRLALINPLISLKSLVLNHDYHPKYIQSSIDGSIAYYDLPDLIAGLSPSRILMINLKDQSGKTIDNYAADPDIQKIFEEYKRKQAEPNFRIKSWGNEPYEVLLKEWLE